MLLKYINQNRIASTAGSASLRGGQLPVLAAPQHHTPPVQVLSFASRNESGTTLGWRSAKAQTDSRRHELQNGT